MAHSLSAKKRVRQNAKRRLINRARKSEIKTVIKSFETAVGSGNKKTAAEQYKIVVRKLDKVAAKGTIHKNRAARLKSRLVRRLAKLKG